MKQIFTLLLFTLCFLSISAQNRNGRTKLTITNGSNEQIKVQVDGRQYNMNGRNDDVAINNLAAGYHSVKIYKEDRKRNNGRWSSLSRYKIVFQKSVYLSRGYQLDLMINRFGKVFMDEAVLDNNYYNDQFPDEDDDNNWSNQHREMDQQVFNQLKTSLQNESFDNSKLTMAQQAIAANWVSTNQVKQLLEVFSFEDNKFALAKYAYPFTTDRNNYFLLYDTFTYSSSKEALAKFIREYKD